MAIIKSISGIRATIGPGSENLNPVNLVEFVAAFAESLKLKKKKNTIVIARDARPSGELFLNLSINTLIAMGVNVLNLDLASTPTAEMAVILEKADAGIIISASHNPRDWNALKLLNKKGEFLSKKEGERVLAIAEKKNFSFEKIDNFGKIKNNFNYNKKHIAEILKLKLVQKNLIKKANLKIVVDGVNSVGAIVVPELLKSLGVSKIININSELNGYFNHDPEPLDKNLKQLSRAVKKHQADLGIAVDPDVDRLALVDNLGNPIGEEYSLVAVADYCFKNNLRANKSTVSNLSSSMALKELASLYGAKYFYSQVGELNVVNKMKKVKALIGGEGNGGIIYPELHYGRDALVGIALFLSYLVKEKKTCSEIRKALPNFFLLKEKIVLNNKVDIDKLFLKLEKKYNKCDIIKIDGLKIVFKDQKAWIHLRRSNTEPIIRIYCEAINFKEANKLFKEFTINLNKNE